MRMILKKNDPFVSPPQKNSVGVSKSVTTSVMKFCRMLSQNIKIKNGVIFLNMTPCPLEGGLQKCASESMGALEDKTLMDAV